jgi:hypothetical protein
MKFHAASDNRGGSVTVKVGNRGDARDASYNVDPSNRYGKVTQNLSERDGAGASQINVSLETSSEFVGYQKATHECAGLKFASKGTIKLPQDTQAHALGVVQDSISMGVRIEHKGKVRLTASVVSDLDVAEIRLQGPAFDKPVRIFDEFDETLDITKPGEYTLKGAYQLNVRLPNNSLGGRPLTVEMQATLMPVS